MPKLCSERDPAMYVNRGRTARVPALLLPLVLGISVSVLGVGLAATPARAQVSADDVSPREAKGLERVASAWLKLGASALKRKLGPEAQRCLAGAREALPAAPQIEAFARASAQVDQANQAKQEASDSARKAFARQEERTLAQVAKLYEALASEAPALRAGRYTWRALQAEPSPERWARLAGGLPALWTSEASARPELSALAKAALGLTPPAEHQGVFARYAALEGLGTQVVLRQAKGHALRYYLSLPSGYDPASERRWSVLVAVDGAGSGFEGCAQGFARARADLPCLVVTPCGFSNTNAIQGPLKERYLTWYSEETLAEAERDRFEFDRAGILQVLSELQSEFHTAPRACVTGFSGGGNLTYQLVFRHPEALLAAAPACANFSRPDWIREKDKHQPDALTLPVFVITGGKDPHKTWTHGKEGSPGIEPQTVSALRTLEAVGFTRVHRLELPDLGHSPAHAKVLEFFRPYLSGERERAAPPVWPE